MDSLSSLRIRHGMPADAAALADFAASAFADAFGSQNSAENIAAYLRQTYSARQQTAELSDPAYRTVLVESDERLVAFAQVRGHQSPSCVEGPQPIELYRFYVDRQWHGHGVARVLMQEVLRAARELDGRTLWLGVWEHNPRAIRFYEKEGFRDVGWADFYLGPERQTDRIMVRPV
jgi:ribosomal protein S18 acetylase RimI-like enzyme